MKSWLARLLIWYYERGSWQYDVIVILILAFIFLTPRSFFDFKKLDEKLLGLGQKSAPAKQVEPDRSFEAKRK